MNYIEIWGNSLGDRAAVFLNVGLLLGLTFGALILLRPVTNRLLRPKYRVWLWFAGWLSGCMYFVNDWFGYVRLLPVTFRTLVTPRMPAPSYNRPDLYPMYLPTELGGAEGDFLVLPGGMQIPLDLPENTLTVIGLLWFAALILLFVLDCRQTDRLRALGRRGEKMDKERMARYGLTWDKVAVRLCEGLPTSFVRWGHDTGLNDGISHVIYLQRELPEARMRLVLLHEEEHIRQWHARFKALMAVELVLFYWWNPVVWLAYRLTCRDMELACDEAVLARLDDRERREYARTLVDLGSGRHMWAATSFGECDAALRVKNAADWKPEPQIRKALSWALALLMVLFFFCGAPAQAKPVHLDAERDWNAYLYSDQLVQDVRRTLQRPDWTPKEVWARQPEELWFLCEDGEWYHVWFQWDERRGYSLKSAQTGWDPFEDCTQIK